MNKEALLEWLNLQLAELEHDLKHAVKFDEYGKATQLYGQKKGIERVIRKIDLGDFG
ncbi:hypothetical protein OCF84_21710 (plasmid) [Shewanella xiamenensis]|uniref:Uncharacterized protein n=1 Tax=Shewanella xiamenensis TaxID=332186 RepID=A0ABT6UDF8_9GAMM|nr:hypothetical protein [Shewanella xiamenensis]MDI5832504.1 hypothetical protein [Shewanella xiamenensis]WHF57877.1 hypothetical protein OCF84_21710 [Shewanella xiamenensis]